MKNTGIRRLCIAIAAAAAIAAAIGLFVTLDRYVLVDGTLYPRGQAVLDLQGHDTSFHTYDTLAKKLPGSTILWDVPFQGASLPSYTEELTISSLSEEDVEVLKYFPQLRIIWADDCRDYEALVQASKQYPACQVNYLVPIDGVSYPSTTQVVELRECTQADLQMLAFLPELREVDGTQCTDYALLMQLQQDRPDLTVDYAITVGGETFDTTTQVLDATGAGYAELSSAIEVMPSLTAIHLTDPTATGEELLRLRQDHPELTITWDLHIGQNSFSDDAEEVDLSGLQLESIDKAKSLAAYFPNITKLIMTDCGFDNETMADFREEMRSEYKVVWTVYFTDKCKARTDETSFMPIKQGEWYFQNKHVGPLKYCEDMIAVDIGHSRVRDIDFAAYMPHLKYLILADTDVRDLSPLSNCKELIWLEVGWDAIESYEPLLGCTALEDLNIGRTFADPEPISKMTWLKNLWCMERSDAVQYAWRQALPNTNIVGKGTDVIAYGWRKLPNYYKMRDALGMYYMN